MHAARKLLLTTALVSATAGLVGAPAAHASVLQHCQSVKGTLSASPGLTDAATSQTITISAKLSGCSRAGGSGGFVVATGATASCATLATALPSTSTTILWANGRTSALSLSFSSLPGATNRVAVFGRVTSGAGAGDRIEGGLHLITISSRTVGQDDHKLTVKQRQPLNSKGTACTAAHPLASIKVSSYQSFKFTQVPPVTPTTTPATRGTQPGGSGAVGPSTTTSAPSPAALEMIARNRAAVARRKAALARRRRSAPAKRRAAGVVAPAGTASTTSDSGFDPAWVLGAGCIVAAVILLALLVAPSKRSRRRRAYRIGR